MVSHSLARKKAKGWGTGMTKTRAAADLGMRRILRDNTNLGSSRVVDEHHAGGRGDGSRVLLAGRVDHHQRPRIPLAAVGDALVFSAPSGQGTPHLGAPGVIALDDEHGGAPAGLFLEDVEHLAEQAVGVVERVEIRSAESI